MSHHWRWNYLKKTDNLTASVLFIFSSAEWFLTKPPGASPVATIHSGFCAISGSERIYTQRLSREKRADKVNDFASLTITAVITNFLFIFRLHVPWQSRGFDTPYDWLTPCSVRCRTQVSSTLVWTRDQSSSRYRNYTRNATDRSRRLRCGRSNRLCGDAILDPPSARRRPCWAVPRGSWGTARSTRWPEVWWRWRRTKRQAAWKSSQMDSILISTSITEEHSKKQITTWSNANMRTNLVNYNSSGSYFFKVLITRLIYYTVPASRWLESNCCLVCSSLFVLMPCDLVDIDVTPRWNHICWVFKLSTETVPWEMRKDLLKAVV